MFEKFKKRSQQQDIIKPQIAKEPEQEDIKKIAKEPQINIGPETPTIINEPEKEIIKEPKVGEKPEITYSKAILIKETESKFMAIKDYSSFSQLTEMINKEISQSKSKLGKYLLQIDQKKAIAEKSRKIRAAVYKFTEKNQNMEAKDEIEINGLQIILDATPRHEIKALERVVKSQQDRLQFLQNTKTALKEFDQFREIQGVNFFVVEKYGVPKKILLTIP